MPCPLGGTNRVLGCVVKAPSTLGTFLRSFRWGHVRQLDRVSRELLARAWATGAGPGDGPLTLDLDSTVCETYGLGKEGARRHNHTGQRGYHPLLAVAAGTGDVLMALLRQGRANTARGVAHFLRETVGRVRYAGATGSAHRAGQQRLLHPRHRRPLSQDEGPLLHHRATAPKTCANIIEAIPEEGWTPIPYWMEGAADVAETTYTPFESKPDATPVRLIVRRVKPTPGYGLTETIKLPRPLIPGAGPKLEHRGEAPADSPVAPPGAWPRAAPGPDTASRSTPLRHPRTPRRRAAWCR